MQLKGKIISWNENKAFGFIAPNGGGDNVFIHKNALSNKVRTPKIDDIITFSVTKDKQGRYCASYATFSGEKLKKQQAHNISKFSIYLATVFLAAIFVAWFTGHLPQKLFYVYSGLSLVTFLAYAIDKAKAQKGSWRTKESTLHLLSLLGGWPGAVIAQQLLRHKSQKREFRIIFWFTVLVNCGALTWLMSSYGGQGLVYFIE